MEAYLWVFWLIVFVVTILLEWVTADIVSMWFSFGALIALIVSLIPGVQWYVQATIFVVLSLTAFIFIRPMLKKLIKNEAIPSNVDEMKGKRGIMIKGCNDLERGEVKINGVVWSAINSNENEPISEGTKVEVLAVSGNKLIVKEIKEEK